MKNPHAPITNPPGFLISLIESNMTVPESFETTAKRKAREESERKERDRRAAEDARQTLEFEYDDYCREETERFIAENPRTFDSVKWGPAIIRPTGIPDFEKPQGIEMAGIP